MFFVILIGAILALSIWSTLAEGQDGINGNMAWGILIAIGFIISLFAEGAGIIILVCVGIAALIGWAYKK